MLQFVILHEEVNICPEMMLPGDIAEGHGLQGGSPLQRRRVHESQQLLVMKRDVVHSQLVEGTLRHAKVGLASVVVEKFKLRRHTVKREEFGTQPAYPVQGERPA